MSDTDNVAMVISIGKNGEIVGIQGEGVTEISQEELESLISAAVKSTCHSMTVHHLTLNPICYVTLGSGRNAVKVPVPCPK
jgi:exosome complex RNA-binding protein Rrp42 (RNase PH superfamily)